MNVTNQQQSAGKEDNRRRSVVFLVCLLAILFMAFVGGRLGISRLAGLQDPRMFFTSKGPVSRDSDLGRKITAILFPGYEDILLESGGLTLFGDDQFAVPTLLLEDGEQVRVQYDWRLPFELAKRRPPKVVIFGSSRAREATRPDILAETLGRPVLNMAVSGATPAAVEVLFDRLFAPIPDKIDLVILFLDDFGYSTTSRAAGLEWRNRISRADSSAPWTRSMSEQAHQILATFPQFRRWPELASAPRFTPCAMADKTEAMKRGVSMNARDWAFDPTMAETFHRLIAKAHAHARKVVVIDTPVTSAHVTATESFRRLYWPAVTESLDATLLPRDLSFWGLSDNDYFGSEGNESCHFDSHHINSAAALRFSHRLVEKLTQ